jgi:uncharacterized protein
MTLRALGLSLLTLILPHAAQAQPPLGKSLTIGRLDSISSGTLKEQRQYLIYTPPSYDDTTTTLQRYPVLYLLDGEAHFHSVSGLVQILGTGINGTFVIPEMIVVAIPNTDRSRDLTPTHTEAGYDGKPSPFFKTTGGMGNFFGFLKNELIPTIDAKYRTTPYRIFVGHSLGGITAINALYTIPETFNAYIAIDPSLWWDNEVLLRKAKNYFSTTKLNGKALYVAQANTLTPDDSTRNIHFEAIGQFNEILKNYNESGLRYDFKYYNNDDHGSVPLIAEYDALRFIFDGYHVPFVRVMATPGLLVEHFRKVSAALGAPFQPSEQMVTMLGEFSLTQDTTKAITFFEMGTMLFPESTISYDRLGEVWLGKGDKEKAKKYFVTALGKNPKDKKAAEQLGKLR